MVLLYVSCSKAWEKRENMYQKEYYKKAEKVTEPLFREVLEKTSQSTLAFC